MRSVFLFTLFFFAAGLCCGQKVVIGNKAELYFSATAAYSTGLGNNAVGSASNPVPDPLPSLIANMRKGRARDLQYVHAVWKKIYVGVMVSQADFSDWKFEDLNTFTGTTVQIRSVSPVIMIKGPILLRGMATSRRLRYFLSIFPGLHRIHTQTSPESTTNGLGFNGYQIPLEVRSTRFGIGFRAGVEVVLCTSWGVALSVGHQRIETNSQFYNEDKFGFATLNAGMFYRLSKDKRYKYSKP